MPTVALFYGIAIRMYYNDHAPPHFHAAIGDNEAIIAIDTGAIVRGRLPRAAQRLVGEWASQRRAALMENWRRARANEPLLRLQGLD